MSDTWRPDELRLDDNLRASLVRRAEVVTAVREFLRAHGLLEITTPLLTRLNPDSTNAFRVESRRYPDRHYGLPTSPHAYKHMLAYAGFTRYAQIAPCFREDLGRRDKAPCEFYQIDVELVGASRAQIMDLAATMVRTLLREFRGIELPPIVELTYAAAIAHYGTDRPDLRNELRIEWASAALCVAAERAGWLRRGDALAWMRIPDRRFEPALERDGHPDVRRMSVRPGMASWPVEIMDLDDDGFALLATGPERAVRNHLVEVRDRVGVCAPASSHGPCALFVVDFPLCERTSSGVEFVHHASTLPAVDPPPDTDPTQLPSTQFDLVIDGIELGGGAMRHDDPEMFERTMRCAGLTGELIASRYGWLQRLLRAGCPPRGGFAIGLERLIMLLTGEDRLERIVAFPHDRAGHEPTLGAPTRA
jgi:aspartyl-tRNA synthetase